MNRHLLFTALSLGLISVGGCAATMPDAMHHAPVPPKNTNQTAYLFRISDGATTTAAMAELTASLKKYAHTPITTVGRRYLRTTFSQDPGLAALDAAIQGRPALDAVQAEQHYGIDPPRRTP